MTADPASIMKSRAVVLTGDRLARIRKAVAEASEGPDLELGGIGQACAGLVAVDGSGVTLVDDCGQIREVIHVSDETIALIEDLQYVVGEGPCIDACVLGAPVLEPDLAHTPTVRWVRFVGDALAAGVGAVFCFPLLAGDNPLESLDLYRTCARRLSDDELANAVVLAAVTTEIVLDLQNRVPPGLLIRELAEAGPYGARVHQATGMVAAQANIGLKPALARLRAHAFSTGRSLAQVTADVVDRRHRFD